nr:hypothetical protein [Draconibacterium sp.]
NVFAIVINHQGQETERTKTLMKTIKSAGGDVFELQDMETDSLYSPLTFPLFFFFAAEYLSDKRKIRSIFEVGNKVTMTQSPSKNEE